MMAVLGDLLHAHARGALNHVKSVHLVWVNQSVEPVHHWFPALLAAVRAAGAPFHLHCYATGSRRASTRAVSSASSDSSPSLAPGSGFPSSAQRSLARASASTSEDIELPPSRGQSVDASDASPVTAATAAQGNSLDAVDISGGVLAGRPDYVRLFDETRAIMGNDVEVRNGSVFVYHLFHDLIVHACFS